MNGSCLQRLWQIEDYVKGYCSVNRFLELEEYVDDFTDFGTGYVNFQVRFIPNFTGFESPAWKDCKPARLEVEIIPESGVGKNTLTKVLITDLNNNEIGVFQHGKNKIEVDIGGNCNRLLTAYILIMIGKIFEIWER